MDVRPLVRGEEEHALELLRRRPVSNVIIASMLLEHGLDDARSRGVFYGCFRGDTLAAVALIGHYFLMDGDEEAARAFARVARLSHSSELTVLLAPPPLAAAFEDVFSAPARECGCAPTAEPNFLLTLTSVATPDHLGAEVRPAWPDETEEVARIHALGSIALQGVDPSAPDPAGYRERVLARVRARRVWVSSDERGITFKTDIAARAGSVVYLEGVLTRPDLLGTGVGTHALSSLCRKLLRRYDTLCLLVAASNQRALDFYQRIGFTPHERYSLVRYPRAFAPSLDRVCRESVGGEQVPCV